MAPPKPLCQKCGFVHPRCTAHTTATGKACNKWPITGINVCGTHGGSNSVSKAAAKRNIREEAARKEMQTLGKPVPVDPSTALLDLISWKHAEVLALRERVNSLPEEDLVWGKRQEEEVGAAQWPGLNVLMGSDQNMWWRLLREAENQLANYAAAAHRAGIAEREVRLAEKQGEMVAGVIRRILARLELTTAQQVLVGEIVPAELRSLSTTVGP